MKKEYILYIILIGALFLFLIGVMAYGIAEGNKEQSKKRYQVFPSIESEGVLCKKVFTSRAGHRFSACEDGMTYINPENYRKVKLK